MPPEKFIPHMWNLPDGRYRARLEGVCSALALMGASGRAKQKERLVETEN